MLDPKDIQKKLEQMPPEKLKAYQAAIEKKMHGKPFIPNPGPQTEAYKSKADWVLYGGSPGGGKALCHETLVPVPVYTDASGYKKHGDLRIGDFVFSSDMTVTEVVAVSEEYDGEGYEFEFNTGEKIKCSQGHIWNTWTQKERDRKYRSTPEWREKRKAGRPSRAKEISQKPWVSKSISIINQNRVYDIIPASSSNKIAKDIAETLFSDKGKKNNHSIQVIQPSYGEYSQLPIDPYLLGVWIGDGTSVQPNITILDTDWESNKHNLPVPDTIRGKKGNEKVLTIRFSFMLPELRNLKILGKKRIPPRYLRSSFEQRVELLRGIMDTDGTCDLRGQMEVGFSDKNLTDDLFDLISSLGIKCTIREKQAKDQFGRGQTHYRVKFVSEIPLFKLKRKLQRQKLTGLDPSVRQRYIISAAPISGVKMKCITVSNPNGLYIVTKSHIVTHNSTLGLGLALNEHHRSLVLRKNFSDLEGIIDTCKKLVGSKDGFVGGTRPKYNKPDGGVIHFAGFSEDGGLGGHQGVDHDFLYVDECAQIPEDQIRLIQGWLRTDKKGQRCRLVLGSNPPLDSTGDWMIKFFAPWLDKNHQNPAQPGEIRWFIPDSNGEDRECDKDACTYIGGLKVTASSRTFIPSKVTDNPYYNAEDYAKQLAALPKDVREILTSGSFMIDRPEGLWQLIPRQWVKEAMARWHTHRPVNMPMSSMGVDCALGGADSTVIACRYDHWFDKLIEVPGKDTKEGSDIAALVLKHRRDNCPVVIDMGGGYGSAAKEHLDNNGVKCVPYKGTKSTEETVKGSGGKGKPIGFPNVRSAAYWAIRDALDPSQPGGSRMALPDDQRLMSELCTPEYRYQNNKYKVESKEEVVNRLGRSTDYADAVVMAWYAGERNVTSTHPGQYMSNSRKPPPRVVLGHPNQRRRK